VFTVENGGVATMIAGRRIQYLPTTTVRPGGRLHGYIAPSGPWCIVPSNPATVPDEAGWPAYAEGSSFIIYPNPTTGSLVIEFKGEMDGTAVNIGIFDMRGDQVLLEAMSGVHKREISLQGRPAGIYFLRVVTGSKAETVKVIKM
jgi:hypothetical protein